MKSHSRSMLITAIVAYAIVTTACAARAQVADAIYRGGDIVTVNDAQPTAEAVAIKNGKILAVGGLADIEKAHKGDGTKIIDLAGKTLAPGFVDGHAARRRIRGPGGRRNLLYPPDGDVTTIGGLVEKLQKFADGPDADRTGWIFGLGYDDALLTRHPNRDDLDKVSMTKPVMAMHISGHFSAVNSVALQKIGYTEATDDPVGGVIRRRGNGSKEPLGVNEENAHFKYVADAVGAKKPEDKDYFLARGLELAKSFGYTTATEGRATGYTHQDLLDAAKRELLDIDVISYIDQTDRKCIDTPWYSKNYQRRYRIGGMKVTLDGSPQGRTAWRTVPYLIPPDGQTPGYKGYPAFPTDEVIVHLFDEAYRKGWPVHVHANGDAAIDQMIRAMKTVHRMYPKADRRHVLIHGQFERKDQLDSFQELDVIQSLFPMHTFYWGDWYEEIIGGYLAQQISPIRSVRRPWSQGHQSHRRSRCAPQPDAGDVGDR